MNTSLNKLLTAMLEERKKYPATEEGDFVFVQSTNHFWPKLFDNYFLSESTRLPQISTSSTSDDDLIFYVTRKLDKDLQHVPHIVEAFRHHDTKRQPKLGIPEYDWEETTNLNLVLHQFEYTVTVAVCIKTSSTSLQIIKRLSTRVYANPSVRDMKKKGIEEKISYPNIYFSVDSFEDIFSQTHVAKGQMVCVELIAKNPLLPNSKVLFLGSIKYDALNRVYETRAASSTRVAQRISLGMLPNHRVEFVRMRGPNGKGHAEMAISQYRSTPSESKVPTSIANPANQENWNKRTSENNNTASPQTPPVLKAKQTASTVATPVVESTDVRQGVEDETAGFLGRRLSQAINWIRGSPPYSNEIESNSPLQTCLTYVTLSCQSIVKDILESEVRPLLSG